MALINKVDSIEKLDALFERSKSGPVVLFKHSNACGISSHVLETVQDIESDLNLIVIQENRALSNEVAVRTGRSHQTTRPRVPTGDTRDCRAPRDPCALTNVRRCWRPAERLKRAAQASTSHSTFPGSSRRA